MTPSPLALVYALKEEIQPILAKTSLHKRMTFGSAHLQEGDCRGVTVVFCQTGISFKRAHHAVAKLLENYRPSKILSLGCAGACRSRLQTGDLVLVSEVWSEEGWKVVTDPSGRDGLAQILKEEDVTYETGPLVTIENVADVDGKKSWGEKGAYVLDMETAAVALAANERGIPFVGLRAIFDGMEEELPWHGSAGDVTPVKSLLQQPKSLLKVPRYFQMNRLCQKNLAKVVLRWVGSQIS